MNEKVNETVKSLKELAQESWKAVTGLGVGFIFCDVANTFMPEGTSKFGKFARRVGAFTLADALCTKVTDSYIDARFEEMKKNLEAKNAEEVKAEEKNGLHEAAQ